MTTPPAPKYRRELSSFVALNTALAQQKLVWDSKPYFLEYSTNSSCNLRCKMCPQSEELPMVSTPRDKREELLDQLLPHATILTPSALSEPLLNNMKTLIPKLQEHQVSLNIITNGALMTPEVLEMMLPHIHQLTFSIDSQIKEIFEMMRSPANFEEVTEKARLSVARCKEVALPVTIHMVLVADNVPHLEGFVDYVVDDLGAHDITVLELLDSTNDFDQLDAFGVHGEEVVGAALEKMRARCEERGVNLRIEVHAPHGQEFTYYDQPARINSAAIMDIMHVELAKSHLGFCPHVMGYLKVEPDGEAFPCCRGPRELRLGNVIEDGFEAVWNGEPMQRLRKQMFEGNLPKVCQGCAVLEAPKWFK